MVQPHRYIWKDLVLSGWAVRSVTISQMNRYPAGVVGVVHCMEPRRQLSQGVQVYLEGSLAQGAKVHQNHQLQLQDGCPVVELEARLCFLLAPIIKFQLLIAFVTELKIVVVGRLCSVDSAVALT